MGKVFVCLALKPRRILKRTAEMMGFIAQLAANIRPVSRGIQAMRLVIRGS